MLAGPERPHGQVEVAGGRLGAGESLERSSTRQAAPAICSETL